MNPAEQEWDAIVIGTGVGGGTIGYALAKAGKRVLFCEKGRDFLSGETALRGQFAETYTRREYSAHPGFRDLYERAGRWVESLADQSGSKLRSFIPFLGVGLGGSSALYGGAMERFFPVDFTPQGLYVSSTGADLPANWPISYEDLSPYYAAAEALYRVHGSPDPLREKTDFSFCAPPPYSDAAQELFDAFQGKGLHPYRLPVAYDYNESCKGCQGFLCRSDCKNDSARICVQPAVSQFGASLMTQCRVERIIVEKGWARGVVCRVAEKEVTLRARLIILAAGALLSPALLLNSACTDWPQGLGNVSGLVGRYLMRHHIDLYVVFPHAKDGLAGNDKELALNDLYHNRDGQKFGTLQSFGAMPPSDIIVEEMQREMRNSAIPGLPWFFAPIKPIMRWGLGKIFSRAIILAAIKEDLPYRENRVMVAEKSGDKDPLLTISYRITPYEENRIKRFREKIASLLRPYRYMLIKQAENNERIAHACGTCRFGDDPEKSVLDPFNRVHGIENLFVTDGSFFPTSGGTNPSLTIAANSLRVADYILKTVTHLSEG